jgi:glycosyltransferase involved in cell wall biosynthesis
MKRKIFVDCHVFDHGFQGTRTYIQGLYLELIKDKNTNFYFAAHDLENLKKIFGQEENVFYLKLKSNNKFYRLLIDIPKLISLNNIDFAHFQYIVPPIKKCKYIVSTHDVLFLEFPQYFPKFNSIKNKILFKHGAKNADIILTGSKYSKNKIEHYLNVKDVKVTVYGVESVFFKEYDKNLVQEEVQKKYGFKKYLVYISRHEPRKNHHRLLKSFIDLELYNNYSLVLIGDVSIRDKEFDKLYLELSESIKNKIVLINKVSFIDMIELLRGATLAVYPSIAEGFGLPPLESVAAKIPTLCSKTTSMAEFDFFESDFINPLDIDELKSKILAKLNKTDRERQSELSKLVAEKYNWIIAAKQFKQILDNYHK